MADAGVSKSVEGVNGNIVIIKKVLEFLLLFLTLTLAKRLAAIVLTRQQIADMIQEKFHVQVSVATVGRLKNGIKN